MRLDNYHSYIYLAEIPILTKKAAGGFYIWREGAKMENHNQLKHLAVCPPVLPPSWLKNHT
jgi:hypothetical protein